jgi:protein-disulfide isomerase
MAQRPHRRERQAQKKESVVKKRWPLLTLIALAAVAIVGIIIFVNNMSNTKPLVFTPRPNANGMSMGDPKAPVKVEDFSDFQCPTCAAFSINEEQAIVDQYVATGKIQVTYIPFSFLGQESINAAAAAYCAADQNKFWEYKEVLYTNQGAENSGAFSNDKLDHFAALAGLNLADFRSCFGSNKYMEKVLNDIATGDSRDVPGSPYFFVNGKGPLDKGHLTAAIDEALNAR